MSNKMTYAFRKLRENKYFGFIKSFAVLLLAVVLFVTSVLAWFTTGDSVRGEGMRISVSNNNGITVGNGKVTLNESVVLPAATKPADDSISAADLAKVIKFNWYEISAGTSTVNVDFDMNDDGLICYCFKVDTEEQKNAVDAADCAARIKSDAARLITVDSRVSFDVQNGKCYVIVVYLADYDKLSSTLNNTVSGSINTCTMSADITFTAGTSGS